MSDKIYKVELTVGNLEKLINRYKDISRALSSNEFKQFLLEKCKKTRDEIMLEKDITSIEQTNQGQAEVYASGNKEEIIGNTISLYNDSVIDITNSNTFFDEEYRDTHYSSELSLAELVEYGVGLVGANSSLGTGDEWEYMQNKARNYNKGWRYKGNMGYPEHTMGTEGKYIYYNLANAIEKNIDNWVEEFLDNKLGSGL